jgi:chemotaxis protein methyltransferase CheR
MIDRLLTILSQRIGMTVPVDRWSFVTADLARAVARLQDEGALPAVGGNAEHFGMAPQLLLLAREAALDHPVLTALIRCITIPESYFFRDTSQFELLAGTVLPQLLEERSEQRSLTVFSAGCSSGEELYSMAIVLAQRGLPELGWDCRLLGGDVSATSVALARAGRYSSWSLRGVQPDVVGRYFSQEGPHFELCPRIRQMARFRTLNLNEPLEVEPQDLIFFRNVSIYFPSEVRRRILENLIGSLREGGYLVAGAAELALESLPQLQCVGHSIYRKQSLPTASAKPLELRPLLPGRPRTAPAAREGPRGRAAGTTVSLAARARRTLVVANPTGASQSCGSSSQPSTSSGVQELTALARRLADSGELVEAERCCLRYLQNHPEDVEIRYLLGLTQQSAGRLDEAVDSFRAAVYFDRSFVAGHFSLALLYAQRRALRPARRHFLQVRQLLAEPQPGRTHANGQTDEQILAITEDQLSRV